VTRARNLLKLRQQQIQLAARAQNLAQKLKDSERSREEALRESSERLAVPKTVTFSFQSVPSRQRFRPRQLKHNQLLTFAVWLLRKMDNHDCDGHHKINDLYGFYAQLDRAVCQPCPKLLQCFAGIACDTGIFPPRAKGKVAAGTTGRPVPGTPSRCIMDRGSNRRAAAHRYPMHDMNSVSTAATLRGPAPPTIPADR